MQRGSDVLALALALCPAIAIAILGSAAPARADVQPQAAFMSGVSWKPSLPALTNDSALTAAREVPKSRVPIGGSLVAVGASFDSSITINDRWTLPLLGFGAYSAIGSYPTIVTSADGSIARVRPWTTYQIDFLLPGFGIRAKQRRWMFSATARTGVSYLHASGTVAGGADETLTTFADASLLLQAELEACRRVDPATRVCLQVAPRIFDFGFMSGATAGLRIEWGR